MRGKWLKEPRQLGILKELGFGNLGLSKALESEDEADGTQTSTVAPAAPTGKRLQEVGSTRERAEGAPTFPPRALKRRHQRRGLRASRHE